MHGSTIPSDAYLARAHESDTLEHAGSVAWWRDTIATPFAKGLNGDVRTDTISLNNFIPITTLAIAWNSDARDYAADYTPPDECYTT